jgi:ectoine hydroxylase-related dioxygenase (phytanoyl-CoA dioxygenase family)
LPQPSERGLLCSEAPDALKRVDAAAVDPSIKQAARDIITDGVTVLRGWQDPALCAAVIEDYGRYADAHREYVAGNLDDRRHEKRLVNFHLWSESSALIATNPRVMAVLDFLFGQEASVYTSLTFKYSTQQPVHRDTPHFATWPRCQFLGVWTALEDIDPASGPVSYYRGAHRFRIDESTFLRQALERLPDAPEPEQLALALDLYNGEVIREALKHGEKRITDLRRGDVVIWHPELPHGGEPADDPELTRWSTVFHCAPADVQVFQHDAFFLHAGPDAPPSRYGYLERHGRKFAQAGDIAYM